MRTTRNFRRPSRIRDKVANHCELYNGNVSVFFRYYSQDFDIESYDTWSKAYNLLDTLTKHTVLFNNEIKQWPHLSQQKKIRIQFICEQCNRLTTKEMMSTSILTTAQDGWATEFYFFVYHKDKQFFDGVVKPYLENKKDKSFVDYWLLHKDLSAFISTNMLVYILFDSFSKINIGIQEVKYHRTDIARNSLPCHVTTNRQLAEQ